MYSGDCVSFKSVYFDNIEECNKKNVKYYKNKRYPDFNEQYYTARDEEQFFTIIKKCKQISTRGEEMEEENSNIHMNIEEYKLYKNLSEKAFKNTFNYIFDKFKKGIYIRIVDNQLEAFLPFSNIYYKNEWSSNINLIINTKKSYEDNVLNVLNNINNNTKYKKFTDIGKLSSFYSTNPTEWYANNCLIRYDLDKNGFIRDNDTNMSNLLNMFEELCKHKEVPDIEFFLNRRDFPLLKKDLTEPYEHMWDNDAQDLVSHKYKEYAPIFSMCNSDDYCDILLPTYQDWARICSKENKWFVDTCRDYTDEFDTRWEDKKNIAVFRGSSTGSGVTSDESNKLYYNPRLKIRKLSMKYPEYIDAGITKWQRRARKLKGNDKLVYPTEGKTIDGKDDEINYLTIEEQSQYKYIINIEGNTSSFRLSMELATRSLILKVDSVWNIWYSKMLIPFNIKTGTIDTEAHYIPVKRDLSDILDIIKWCNNNSNICKKIVENARKFYDINLSNKDSILNYIQKLLIKTKKHVKTYTKCKKYALDIQLENERNIQLDYKYPNVELTRQIPPNFFNDCNDEYDTYKAINYIFDREACLSPDSIFNNKYTKLILVSKSCLIYKYNYNGIDLVFKETNDIINNKVLKRQENLHDAFIGTKCINELLKECVNFVYTFGYYEIDKCYPQILKEEQNYSKVNKKLGLTFEDIESKDKVKTYITVNKYIEGETLFDYIQSKSRPFDIKKFVEIMLQICLSIEYAQNTCGFVHYDLMAWNIIIKHEKKDRVLLYKINNKTYKIKTNVIAYIIDYGKSSANYNNINYGMIMLYNNKYLEVQDIFTIFMSCIVSIQKYVNLTEIKYDNLFLFIHICNFITNTELRKDRFNNLGKQFRFFIKKFKYYSPIVYCNKDSIKDKTPLALFNYLTKEKIEKYRTSLTAKLNINTLKIFDNLDGNFSINKELKSKVLSHPELSAIYYANIKNTCMQIFNEYIGLINKDENLVFKSYTNYLNKLLNTNINNTENILVKYYEAQTLYYNFVITLNKLNKNYPKFVNNKEIENIYNKFIKEIGYLSLNRCKNLDNAKYTNKTYNFCYTSDIFLDIDTVNNILVKYPLYIDNIMSYRKIIESILMFDTKDNSIDCNLPEYIRISNKNSINSFLNFDVKSVVISSSWIKTFYYMSVLFYTNELKSSKDNSVYCNKIQNILNLISLKI